MAGSVGRSPFQVGLRVDWFNPWGYGPVGILWRSALQFINPPVNEVGISVSFAERKFISEFAIQELHSLFQDEFPYVERAAPAPGPDILAVNGYAPLNIESPLSRWWLKSSDDRFVIQLQENFFALNWRRRAPRGEACDYPGYETMKGNFDRYLKIILQWQSSKGMGCPAPIAAELYYDDIIEIKQSQEKIKLSSFLSFWNSENAAAPLLGWSVNWVEQIGSDTAPSGPVMKFTAMLAGFAEEEEPEQFVPVLRLNFNAMGMLENMDGIDRFFEDAHLHVGARFNSLIASQAREAWGRKE
jgi:uncharacterized protein (TIGR04255 family)